MNARTPMSEPGEPRAPDADVPRRRDEVDHDDLIGFASPAALEGRRREVAPAPVEPEPEPEPASGLSVEPIAPEPAAPPVAPEPPVSPVVQPVFEAVAPRPMVPPRPEPRFVPEAEPEPVPAWARETPLSEQPANSRGRRREQTAPIDGAMSLYTIYALILFAVPTLGVSAAIALFAVMTRTAPQDALAASHFRFQKLTLMIGAGVALVGGVLIAVGLGVFVLFLLAIWLIVRGASGILKLKASRPIERPSTWLI